MMKISIAFAAFASVIGCSDATGTPVADAGGGHDTVVPTPDANDDRMTLSKPTDVIAAADVSKGAHVRWSPPANGGNGIKTYTVTATPGGAKVTTTDATTTSAFFIGLTVGQSYTFVVTANDGSDGPPSNPSSPLTIVGAGLPGVSVCAGDAHNTLYWPPVAGAVSYNVYWATTAGVTKLSGSKLAGVTSPYQHASLLDGWTFFYVVTSVDSTSAESAVSDEVTATTGADVKDTFFASTYSKAGRAIEIFDCFSHVPNLSSGGSRSISGTSTNIGAASTMNVWVDKSSAVLYLATGPGTVDIWNHATTVTGNVAPDRVLTGASTKLNSPAGIVLDKKHDVLYVANSGGAINLWSPGSTASGNQAPTATITGTNTKLQLAYQLAVDEANDRLYVAAGTGVRVFNGASKLTGTQNIAPDRDIDFSATTASGYGTDLDLGKDILYVGARDTNAVYMFDSASTLSGPTSPKRFIQGMDTLSPTYNTMQVRVAADTLYLLQDSASAVHIWNNASTLNGTTPAPDRNIGFTLVAGGFHYVQ